MRAKPLDLDTGAAAGGGYGWEEDIAGEEEPGEEGDTATDDDGDEGGAGDDAAAAKAAEEAAALAAAEAAKTEPDPLAEVEARRKALQDEIDALDAAKAEREAAKAEADRKARVESGDILGLYEESLTEIQAKAARVAELEAKVAAFEAAEAERVAAVEAANAEIVAKLHPDVQALVPETDPAALAALLPRLQAMSDTLSAKPAGGKGGVGATGGLEEEIPAECVEMAKRLGEKPDRQFFEHIFKPFLAKQEAMKRPPHLRIAGSAG